MSKRSADRNRRRVGVALMAASLGIAGSVLSLAPATAQADPVPLEVTKTAYFVNSAGKAAPNTLTSEFPPGVVCVVRPEMCPESLRPVTDVVGGVVGTVEELPDEPTGTVQPGTLPVEVFSGSPHYSAALQFTLPELSSGSEVGRFVLRLEQVNPTFHLSSPAFRQAVLAAVASAGAGAPVAEEFAKIFEKDPVEITQFLGVEACPATAPFEDAGPGRGQANDARPEIDCLYGANGVKGDGTTWEFDLSFAAEAWYSGQIENHGIVLRTTGAPNLAFGDADNSTFSRVTFASAGATGELEERPRSEPPAPFTPPSDNGGSSGGFEAPSSSGEIFAPPASYTPEVADSGSDEAPAPEVAQDDSAPVPVAASPLTPDPTTPWWIWLLVPVFLAGMYLTANSLTTEVVLAGERRGAMMRLIDQQGPAEATKAPRSGALGRLTGRE